MTGLEFTQKIKTEPVAACYLFTGDEEYLKQQALKSLRKRILPPGLEEMNETTLKNPDAGTLIAACETLPFGAEKRLVVVKECSLLNPSKASGEEGGGDDRIAEYVGRLPGQELCLVFYAEGEAGKQRKLYKACAAAGMVVEFKALDDATLRKWIIQTLKKSCKTIGPEEVNFLLATVGKKDTACLLQELNKLAAYLGDAEAVTKEAIGAICTPSSECTVFQMVDAQVCGRTGEALRLLNLLYANGENGLMVLAMLLRQYRILYHMRCLTDEKTPPAQIPSLLGISPYGVDRTRRQASRYPKEALRRAYDSLLDMEYRIKQGKFSDKGCAEAAILMLEEILSPSGKEMGA